MTENGLVHPDYGSRYPYGPLGLPSDAYQLLRLVTQIPFAHQGAMWMLVQKSDVEKTAPFRVTGAQLTSCGVELLQIVDIETLPDFTVKLVGYFAQSGYQMTSGELLK